jgi:hypothetical protein
MVKNGNKMVKNGNKMVKKSILKLREDHFGGFWGVLGGFGGFWGVLGVFLEPCWGFF